MAFGFIKKIFSFGKKQVEEVREEETPVVEIRDVTPLLPEAEAEAPILSEPELIATLSADPVAEFPRSAEPDVRPTPGAEAIVPKAEKPVRVAKTKPAPAKMPAAPRPPEENAVDLEPEQTAQEMTAEARSDASFAPDGVFQPTPETADNGLPHIDTPEPLDESPEPEPGHPQPLPTLEGAAVETTAEETPVELGPEPVGSDGGFAGESDLAAPLVAAAIPVSSSEGKVYIGKIEDVPPPLEPEEKVSWFQRLKRGLSRSSKELSTSITGIFTKRKLDEETLQELEDVLIRADLGMETAIRITDALSAGRFGKDVSDEEVRGVMRAEIEKVLGPVAKPLELDLSHKPHVILVVGVNGTGKTTTIGKLAAKLREAKLNVWLAAGDTFRAAAIEQLHIWGQRTGSPVVSNKIGSDAAGLAYDAFEKAKEAGADVLIIDTAGRLQNRTELMDELAKIVRVLGKLDREAPHTVLQTLDATTGQNALNQVEIFRNIAGVNGLVMTKLDGTARGGILVGIAAKHKLPVYFVGVGEQVADLEPFSAKEFAAAIAGTEQ
jgi:fused signal recognition particle receptor